MRAVLTVWPEEIRETPDTVGRSARLEIPGLPTFELWYRAPAELRAHLSGRDDAFLVASIHRAMRLGHDIRLRGRVSPGLLANLDELVAAWSAWRPDRYHRVQVDADGEWAGDDAAPEEALSAFSGGLDSCHTVWRNRHSARRVPPITGAVFAHGFDIPIEQTDVFQRATLRARAILDSVGIPLIPVTSNIRAMGDDWLDTHGAGVSSALMLLGRRHRYGLIPSTHSYAELRIPFGSNPVSDPLCSSDRFTIRYDGATQTRPGKAAAVAAWPEAMEHMRVCWSGPQLDRNCGACRKCVGTAICFAAAGVPLPPALSIPDLAAAIRAMAASPMNAYGSRRVEGALALARARGIDAPWMEAAAEWVARSKPRSPSLVVALKSRVRGFIHAVRHG